MAEHREWSFRSAARLSLLTALLLVVDASVRLAACQRSVQGFTLGVTSLSDLIGKRGEPQDSGRTNDGWRYIVYGRSPRYAYYYSSDDFILEWARVFPVSGYTAARVHEAFGRPDTTLYGDDLSKREHFDSAGVIVEFGPDGNVSYIEYQPSHGFSIASRRHRRATLVLDSILADTLGRVLGVSRVVALDSLNILKRAREARIVWRARPPAQRGPLARPVAEHAARYDSLCAVMNCQGILRANRAFDSDP